MATYQTVYNSSQLDSGKYSDVTKKLIIKFKNGAMYEYDNVTMQEWNDLKNAASQGRYFNERIKNVKTFRKL